MLMMGTNDMVSVEQTYSTVSNSMTVWRVEHVGNGSHN